MGQSSPTEILAKREGKRRNKSHPTRRSAGSMQRGRLRKGDPALTSLLLLVWSSRVGAEAVRGSKVVIDGSGFRLGGERGKRPRPDQNPSNCLHRESSNPHKYFLTLFDNPSTPIPKISLVSTRPPLSGDEVVCNPPNSLATDGVHSAKNGLVVFCPSTPVAGLPCAPTELSPSPVHTRVLGYRLDSAKFCSFLLLSPCLFSRPSERVAAAPSPSHVSPNLNENQKLGAPGKDGSPAGGAWVAMGRRPGSDPRGK